MQNSLFTSLNVNNKFFTSFEVRVCKNKLIKTYSIQCNRELYKNSTFV